MITLSRADLNEAS
jgi:predicted  nucleic acid-binding Zn-ribbon protein